jgi:hypothetical protein
MERQKSVSNCIARVLFVAGSMCLGCGTGRASAQKDILFLNPTLSGGANSLEYRIVATPTSSFVAGTAITGLGLTADIASTYAGWTTPPQPYSSYKAIVFGDPNCTINSPAPFAAAMTNIPQWTSAVTGNVIIIGTDPTAHGTSNRGAQLWKSAIQYAASGSGTGAVIALSCYYSLAVPSTAVNVLSGFGTFTVTGVGYTANTCNAITMVAAVPSLTGLAASNLSGWNCSVHEWFDSWPTNFLPLAIVTDLVGVPPNFTAADGTKGNPYILIRGGILKVCKAAGAGVAAGTPFTFSVGGTTLSVPAGPGPGGSCVIGPTLPPGSQVTVTETVAAGMVVSSITVAPPDRVVGAPSLSGGSVTVSIGSGVTEATFINDMASSSGALGFLEICKRGNVTGSATFTVDPGGLGPFVVPAGACSAPIKVQAGTVVIAEAQIPNSTLVGCATIPANRQGACNLGARTSTVTVVAGDASTQTIAVLTNQ